MSIEADVGKGAGTAIGIAAAVCSVVPGIGTGFCALGAAIASAFTAAGLAISQAGRDQFTFTPREAVSWWLLAQVDPAILFEGIDNTYGDPAKAARLVRYLSVRAGLLRPGELGNDGTLENPGNANPSNPALRVANPRDPLTDETTLAKLLAGYRAWQAAGAPPTITIGGRTIEAFPHYVPQQLPHPQDAASLLTYLRRHADDIRTFAGGQVFRDHANEVQSQVRALRLKAGEDGPDPGGILTSLFGGDLTVHRVLPARDPKLAGAYEPVITPGRVAAFVVGAVAVGGFVWIFTKKRR